MTRDLVVIPVYNESRTLRQVIEATLGLTRARVLVVDDGSTDGSAEVVEALSSPRVECLRHPKNLGYGRALRDGFRVALERGDRFLVTLDADTQHEPAWIPRFLQRIRAAGVDVLSGSRYLEPLPAGSRGTIPPERLAINREITQRVNAVTGFGITDAFCGFKAYRVEALRGLHLTEDGYAFPLEFWAEAWRKGLEVLEEPVPPVYSHTFERRFPGPLDDPEVRRAYYLKVWERSIRRAGASGCCPPPPEPDRGEAACR
ncbi:glycosyltransferase family 2 protein [Limnochorda pilosa]|uniref:Dolichyl-phosphate mannose synthase n=1 Tax=Limnochorda pilosa TaxID=1555112 RepID=A0A0K2SP90_LIMPI|nr:glycosyltransferase family 2 protein [Limnochorda pilosa]BAS28812.1 dolichyl-phosphate mannose synthase [Limnochorda pilosa]